ncbi:MAG: discoidin domain-containing protein [Candidatus Rokuibacteriota bacterium]
MSANPRRWRWGLVAIFLVALLIRIPPLFAVSMWYDEAVEGLMSQDVLRGRFPLFFYGQPVHGVADRYLAALVILLLGSTPLALKLAMVPLSFVFLGSIAYTTRRTFGPGVATIATLMLAVPPYYLFGWNFDSRGHYMMMLILGTWLTFITWRIGQEGVARSPRRRFVGLGLLAGLAWWTNYLSITFLAPIAVALALAGIRAMAREWRSLSRRGALALGAFAVGVSPLYGYYLGHRLPLLPPGSFVGEERVEAHVTGLAVDALPQILGVHPAIWRSAYGVVYAVVAALTLTALLYSAGWWLAARRRAGSDGGTVGLLLGVVTITILLATLTQYGTILRYPRYLLPLHLALPVFLGIALDRVGRVSAPIKWIVVAAVALNNLLGSLVLTPILAPQTVAQQRDWAAITETEIRFFERHGLRRLYGGHNHWSFLSDQRVIVSDPYQERMAEFAREVDTADRIGWVFGSPAGAFEQSARAAGIHYRRLDGPGLVVYTEFTLPTIGYADIDPDGWSGTASHRPEDAHFAYDRRVDSTWRARLRQEPGQFYQLDLGRIHTLGLVSWLPWRYQEVPAGFVVTVSADALAWQEVARVPRYFGPLYWSGTHPFQRVRRSRVEIRFAPVDARFVRIELTSSGSPHTWSIRELIVATPVSECPRRHAPEALVHFLRDHGVQWAYADHWLSAAMAKASGGGIGVLPSNVSVNSYRLERPALDEIEHVRKRRTAIVVEDCPGAIADGVAARLRDTGVRFARHTLAGFVVFTSLEPLAYGGEPATWRTADGGSRVLVIELRAPRRAEYVAVQCSATPESPILPGEVTVETSEGTAAFVATPFQLVQRGLLRMSGSRLFRDPPSMLVFTFEPRRLGSVRITARPGTWDGCAVKAVRVGPPI